MIGQTISHYRILSKLGEGGMGVVYVGEDTVLGRRVAIKMMTVVADKQHYRMRFLREARSVSALSHLHIAAVYDYGETPEGTPFIVMELVEGQTLDQLMRSGTLTLSRAVEIAEKVAQALAEAHRLSIVHRDIKPSNIAIGTRGEVKILDFGLAKHIDNEHPDADTSEACALAATRTREGVIVGTPLYLSPEQALGVQVDARSDIFSLGSLLYECAAGRPAFQGTSVVDICAKVIRDDPMPPSHYNPRVPAPLDRIILKALAKRPEERYQSAGELLTDLTAGRASMQGETDLPRRPPVTPLVSRPPSQISISRIIRRPQTLGAVFLIALAVGVTVWLALSWRSSAPLWNSREAERRFAEGVDALRDGTYNKARKLFEDAISLEDRAPLAHAGLAESLVELDDPRKAEGEIALAHSLVVERGGVTELYHLSIGATEDTVRHNLDGAVQKYEQIVRLTPDDDVSGKSRAYVDLGRAWEKEGNTAKALENYHAAATRDPQAAAAFLHLGIVHGLLSTEQSASAAEQSLSEFARAEALYETSSNYEGVTEVLLQRGAVLAAQGGKGNEARAQFVKALNITRTTTGNKHQEIRALLSLSGVAVTEGKTDEAKDYAAEAVNSAKAAGMENLTAQGLVDLGNAFFLRREYDDAEIYLKEALELAQRYGEDFSAARAQLFLAKLYVQKEQLDEGLSYTGRALDFYRRAGYGRETSEALLLDGRARLLKRDYDKGLQSLKQALELAQRIQDVALIARAHTELGFCLASQELYPAALSHYEESYKINQSLDDPRRTAYSLLGRGDMLWRLGSYDEADKALSLASVVAERSDDEYRRIDLTRISLMRAQMELSRQNFSEAIKKAELAQQEAGPKIKYTAIETKSALGLALALSGKRREGVPLCREAVAAARAASFSTPPLVAGMLLALAEAELGSGEAQSSLNDAIEAQATFAGTGQQESEYRAHLVAARALSRLKQFDAAREHFAQAKDLSLALQRYWGADYYYNYIARPDLRAANDQLIAALATH